MRCKRSTCKICSAGLHNVVFEMRYEGKSYEEIAKEIGVSFMTVKRHLEAIEEDLGIVIYDEEYANDKKAGNTNRVVRREKYRLPEEEWKYAYLAGLIDGEGSIMVGSGKLLTIANTNLDVMNWLVDNFGGTIYRNRIRKNRIKYKSTPYIWYICNSKIVLEILKRCVKYMIIKREKAIMLLKKLNQYRD